MQFVLLQKSYSLDEFARLNDIGLRRLSSVLAGFRIG
jgi:hypothetical protein